MAIPPDQTRRTQGLDENQREVLSDIWRGIFLAEQARTGRTGQASPGPTRSPSSTAQGATGSERRGPTRSSSSTAQGATGSERREQPRTPGAGANATGAHGQHGVGPIESLNQFINSIRDIFGIDEMVFEMSKLYSSILILVAFSAIPILMVVIGTCYLNACNKMAFLPKYLVIGGLIWIAARLRTILNIKTSISVMVLLFFLPMIWTFVGVGILFWIFNDVDYDNIQSTNYCNRVLFRFTSMSIIMGFLTYICETICCCICMVIGLLWVCVNGLIVARNHAMGRNGNFGLHMD